MLAVCHLWAEVVKYSIDELTDFPPRTILSRKWLIVN